MIILFNLQKKGDKCDELKLLISLPRKFNYHFKGLDTNVISHYPRACNYSLALISVRT